LFWCGIFVVIKQHWFSCGLLKPLILEKLNLTLLKRLLLLESGGGIEKTDKKKKTLKNRYLERSCCFWCNLGSLCTKKARSYGFFGGLCSLKYRLKQGLKLGILNACFK
jgi:hypothetical protein